jgi:hypothetical protein
MDIMELRRHKAVREFSWRREVVAFIEGGVCRISADFASPPGDVPRPVARDA